MKPQREGFRDGEPNAGESFYDFACRTWRDKMRIPKDHAEVSAWTTLTDGARHQQRSLLERLTTAHRSAPTQAGSHTADAMTALCDFWTSALDEDSIEAVGLTPLDPLLNVINDGCGATSCKRTRMLSHLHSFGVPAFFHTRATVQDSDSTVTRLEVVRGGLGLPHPSLYFSKPSVLTAYQAHISKVLTLLGETHVAAQHGASAVMRMEIAMAASETRRPLAPPPSSRVASSFSCCLRMCCRASTNAAASGTSLAAQRAGVQPPMQHELSVSELNALARTDALRCGPCAGGADAEAGVSWSEYLDSVGVPGGSVLVESREVLAAACTVFATAPESSLRAYLLWHVALSFTPYLPACFHDAHVRFFGRLLQGQQEAAPRWQLALQATEEAFGELLGQLYVCEAPFP